MNATDDVAVAAVNFLVNSQIAVATSSQPYQFSYTVPANATSLADHLTALLSAIVSQQLSTRAAATIFGRLVALFDGGTIPHAAAIAAIDDDRLRSVGLSRFRDCSESSAL